MKTRLLVGGFILFCLTIWGIQNKYFYHQFHYLDPLNFYSCDQDGCRSKGLPFGTILPGEAVSLITEWNAAGGWVKDGETITEGSASVIGNCKSFVVQDATDSYVEAVMWDGDIKDGDKVSGLLEYTGLRYINNKTQNKTMSIFVFSQKGDSRYGALAYGLDSCIFYK